MTYNSTVYSPSVDTIELFAVIPKNPKSEIFCVPLADGSKLSFDITAMNEYWNGLTGACNFEIPLCKEICREFEADGYIEAQRVERFADVILRHSALGIPTRARPMLGVETHDGLVIVDGRHTYMALAMLHLDEVLAGSELYHPAYIFAEHEWIHFVLEGDVPEPVPFASRVMQQ
ncbi:hypothetical protein V6R86_13120 [Sphingomonas kaistensis]|uniref:Uncharacterized protein n=1 Tax=Sphingomonas kaistensis TaxID=298708 RepID=A0ABZ2G3A4_9SPHN